MQDFQAFTIRYQGRVNVLRSEIGVSQAYDPQITTIAKRPLTTKGIAIWDTGASCSVITSALAAKIGLIPTGKTQLTGVNNSTIENTYLVNIFLPNKVAFMYVRVAEVPGILGGDILIGMDIIGMGDLSVFTELGKTIMTFRTPSIGGEDFVTIANKINRERVLADKLKRDAQVRKQLTPKVREKRKKKKKIQEMSRQKNRKH